MTSPLNPRDDLSALLDGELDAEALAAFEAEVEADEELRSELAGLREVASGLRALAEVRAPDGFLAGVMARIDAGDGVGEPLFAPIAVAVAPPLAGAVPAPVALPPDASPRPNNVFRLPFWVRGPAIASLAAALLVGVGFALRDPGLGDPPALEELALGRVESGPASPRPTGLLREEAGEDAGDDGVVAVERAETPSAEDAPAPLRLRPEEAARVTMGGTGMSPAAEPRRSGLRETGGRSRAPAGIYVAPFESPELDTAEFAHAHEERADEDAFAAADEEPSAEARSEAGAGGFAGAPAALSAAPAAKSSRARPTAERAAMEGIARLTTGDAGAILRLRDAVSAKGWILRFLSPAEGPVTLSDAHPEQVLELVIPAGSEAAAQLLLERHGAFSFLSTSEASADDASRLRVTVVFRR